MDEMQRRHELELEGMRKEVNQQKIEALERKVKILSEEVSRWRKCAEEASQAASNTQQDLHIMEKRYDDLKIQLIQGTQDEVLAAENEASKFSANEAAATWERRFLELQCKYDQLQLKITGRDHDGVNKEDEQIGTEREAAAAAAQWELLTKENDILMKENDFLRKHISDVDHRTNSSTAASTPLPDNRSLHSTPQPQSVTGFVSSSSTTSAPAQDPLRVSSTTPVPIPEDFANTLDSDMSWAEMQKVMGDLSTEDLIRMTRRQQ